MILNIIVGAYLLGCLVAFIIAIRDHYDNGITISEVLFCFFMMYMSWLLVFIFFADDIVNSNFLQKKRFVKKWK